MLNSAKFMLYYNFAPLNNILDSLAQTDIEIWNEFKNGDENALCFIFDKYYNTLCSYGYNFTKDIYVIENCVQDIFLELIRRRKKLSNTDNIQFYLMKSLRRRITRTDNSAQSRLIQFQSDKIIPDNEPIIDTDFNKQDNSLQKRKIKASIDVLPDRQKEVIYLKYYFNFSNPEIAKIMEIKYQTVSNTHQKALKNLRNSL